jgi:hypothetical protein
MGSGAAGGTLVNHDAAPNPNPNPSPQFTRHLSSLRARST